MIVAANHASNLDVPVVGSHAHAPALGRRWQWLGKRELFDWPVVGWLARQRRRPRGRPRRPPTSRPTAWPSSILDEGHALFVFPEGTRSRDGALQQARDGVAVLALRTGAPIVPVGIAGSYERWPRGQKLPHPGGHVTVRVGEPVPPRRRAARRASTARAATPLATDLIMRRIAALLPAGASAAPTPTTAPPRGPTRALVR